MLNSLLPKIMFHTTVCRVYIWENNVVKLVPILDQSMYIYDEICNLGAKVDEDTENFAALKSHKNSVVHTRETGIR